MHRVVEEIVDGNRWRDGEFAKFKINSLYIDEPLWCRMCIPMIYAHWEGFVVSSLKILIEHLNRLELSPSKVPTKLVVMGLGRAFKPLSGNQSFEKRVEFTDKFNGLFREAMKFEKKIDTKSNLKSDVLCELCQMFSFNFENFKDVTADIDRLVIIRNSIAHGENSILPDIANITKYIESVNMAMDILLREIDSYLENESYLLTESPVQEINRSDAALATGTVMTLRGD